MNKEISDLKFENDALEKSTALNRIVLQVLDERRKDVNRLLRCIVFLCITMIAVVSVLCYFSYKEKQALTAELESTRVDFMEYLDTVGYTETTTTTDNHETTVTQDTGEGNGNNIYQAGQDAVYNESASEEGEF